MPWRRSYLLFGAFLFGVLGWWPAGVSAQPLVLSGGSCAGVNPVEVSIAVTNVPDLTLSNVRVRVGLGAGEQWQYLGDVKTAAKQTFNVCATNTLSIPNNGSSVVPVLLRFDFRPPGLTRSEHYAGGFDLPADHFNGRVEIVIPAGILEGRNVPIAVNGVANIGSLGKLPADFKYSYNANCEVGVISEVTPGHEFGHGGMECDVFAGGRYCQFEYQLNVSGGSLLFPGTAGQLSTDLQSCDQLERAGNLEWNAVAGILPPKREIDWYVHFTPGAPMIAKWVGANFFAPFSGRAFGRGRFTNRPTIFVTGGRTTSGSFGGLAGGDRICQQIAKKFHGQWVAWLSDTSTDARDRFFYNGPFALPNQEIVAYTKQDLLNGTLLHPINIGDNGAPAADNGVWTGTRPNGARSGYSCDNWTNSSSRSYGTLGESKSATGTWTSYQDSACSRSLYLYCLRKGDPSIFVAKDWDSFGDFGYGDFGTLRADKRCQSIAEAKGFVGTWETWASETGHDARDRTGFSGPFVLPNGEVVADDRQQLLNGQLKHPIDITEDGDRITPGEVWTGTNADGTRSQACIDWETKSSKYGGAVGYTESTGGGWTKTAVRPCSERHYHYCVRE